MHLPRAIVWLYRKRRAIYPFRWTIANRCLRSFNPDSCDCPTDSFSNISLCSDPQSDGRSVSLTSFNHPASDGDDDATCASSQQGNYETTCASLQAASSAYEEAKPPDRSKCFTKQVVPFEPTATVTDRDEYLHWQEEKKKWVSAAGVSTPAELKRKLCRDSSHNEADVEKLTRYVMEVRLFLLRLHELDKDVAKRKRCEQPDRRRKRFRRECLSVGSYCGAVDTGGPSMEKKTENGGGPLLDPEIMNCFRTLIKSSA